MPNIRFSTVSIGIEAAVQIVSLPGLLLGSKGLLGLKKELQYSERKKKDHDSESNQDGV